MSPIAQARLVIGAALALLGIIVMAGWLAGYAPAARVAPTFVGMVFGTAFCFTLIGIALLMPTSSRPRRTQTVIGWTLLTVASLFLIENIVDLSFGLDLPSLHAWLDDHNPRPGRMAPNTAVGFMLCALTLLLMQDVQSKARALAVQIATLAVLLMGLTGLVGYSLHLELLYSWFHSARMAVHTAIGLILSALGLLLAWGRADWYRSRRYFKEDEKVSFVGAMALVVVAMTTGIAGFAAQQTALETTLTDNLNTLMKRRVGLFQTVIRHSIADGTALAGRADVVAALRAFNSNKSDSAAFVRLRDIGSNLVMAQVSGITILDANGRHVTQLGKPVAEPEIAIEVAGTVPATLLWRDGLYLRIRSAVIDGKEVIGTLVIDQRLHVLTEQLAKQEGVGRTGSVAMCVLEFDGFLCLPMSNVLRTQKIPRYNPSGQALPMTFAATGQSGTFKGLDFKGRQVIAVYGPVTQSGLGIVVKQETEELYRPTREQVEKTAPLLFVFVLISAWLLRLNVKPLATKLLLSESKAREALATVKASKERIRTIIESAQDAFVGMDLSGNIIDWNSQAEAMFGYSREEAIGRPLTTTIIPERFRPLYEEALQKLNVTGQIEFINQRLERTVIHRNGHEFPVEIVIGLVQANDNYFFSAFVRDISARKQAERELHQAKDRAEAAARAKSEFLANMSHEIRTPMNGVIGLTNVVLKTDLSAQQREYLSLIKASADSLLRLLNDILDFSKMEARQLELEVIEFDARESIGNTLKAFSATANEKGLELTYHVAPDVPMRLLGDPGRLAQIIVNLVGNALKFTMRGEVVVRVAREMDAEARTLLHLSVADTGIGMSDEQQAGIFKSFAQADNSTTRQYGGTGLGLSIVSQLVALMGGAIRVESQPNKGTTFHLTLQFAIPAVHPTSVAEPAPVALRDMAVLVVDDNRTNRLILAENVRNWNMHPVLADSGRQALHKLVRAAAQGQPFPLVLVDSQMPELDGFELVQAIKSDPAIDSATIMMLSSSDMSGEIERCEALGVARFLRKPVKQSELFDAIVTALGLVSPEHSHKSDAIPERPLRLLHVLVAEDHPVNQMLVTEILKSRGHSFAIANNGVEVLQLLEREPFDVILMDGQMPEMDGYHATAEIRRRERATGRHIRIIAVTANVMKGDRAKCLESGMDEYVSKPIDPDQLLGLLERGVRRPADMAEPETAPKTAAVRPPLNFEQLLKAARGKRSLVENMARQLLESLPAGVADIREAVAAGDAGRLERAAHRLRGAAAVFRADPLAEVAARLEHLGRKAELAQAWEAVSELDARASELATELKSILQSTT
jgi:two-component system sensor histidine kinase/response regulator